MLKVKCVHMKAEAKLEILEIIITVGIEARGKDPMWTRLWLQISL